MENLHTDMVENILSRLPLETALLAKRVCKTWRVLLRSKTDKVGLLLAASYSHDRKKNKLIYGDHYDDIRGKMINYNNSHDSLLEKLHGDDFIRAYKYMDGMIVSCNGLVCFEIQRTYHRGKPFLIFNPLTGETVYVPKSNKSIASSGFGYCHSTDEYKIVRMDYQFKAAGKYRVQVYTLGGGDEWRNIGYLDFSPLDLEGTYANEALHWLHRKHKPQENYAIEDYTVVAFDLEDEKFRLIPLSRFNNVKYQHFPKLLGGNNLYLAYTTYDKPYCTDIWAYKRSNTNTTDGCDTREKYDNKNSWHWIKEFSIEWEEQYWKDLAYFEPLAITRQSDGVLLRHGYKTLYCYDLKTSTFNKIFDGCAMGCNVINVIPHANSIVSMSLKECEDGRDPN